MENYTYIAYDQAGARHQGELSALNPASAKFKLKDLGLVPVKIQSLTSKKNMAWLQKQLQEYRKPGLAEVEFFSSQLTILLKGGIKIDKSIEIVANGLKNFRLKQIAQTVRDDVRAGISLSQSLAKYPDVFDSLYVSITSIGEATGRLPETFAEISANLSFRQNVAAKTRQALTYPVIILVVCLFSVIFIFNFIIPKFHVLFSGIKNLPVYTTMLLGVSDFFTQYQWALLLLACTLPVLFKRLAKNDAFQKGVDALVIKAPLTNTLVYTLENLRFASSMAILLKNDVLLVDAITYSIRSIGNKLIRKKLLGVKDEIKHGKKFSETLGKTGFLPEIFAGVIEVGEQTGSLSEIFKDMEQRLRVDYEYKLTRLITLIEPTMIIVMGLIVGSVVVVMLLSMVSIQDVGF